MPGDQYASYAKAVAYGLRRAETPAPIVGGVTARFAPTFLDDCASGDLIRRIDAFSFHDYGPAMAFEDLIAQYREWLRTSGVADLPLWVTECGWPWNRGPERPPVDQDRASAAQIAMKAVEARACGVERFFTFVYPFYEENAKNFSVMDRRATPLRSMTAYAQTMRALKGLRYVGDLHCDDSRIARARVFGDELRAVVVLHSATPEAEFRKRGPIQLGAIPRRVEGADGREHAVRDGRFEMADGLAFVWFDAAALKGLVDSNTRAGGLHPGPRSSRVAQAEPIVLRLRFDPAHVTPSSSGYHVKSPSRTLPVVVDAMNLGDSAESLDLTLTVGSKPIDGVRKASVGPRSQAESRWEVPLAGRFADFEPLQLQVAARGSGSVRDRLAFTLLGEPSFEEAVAHLKTRERLPIDDLTRWSPNVGAGGEMRMEVAEGSGWRLVTRHRPNTDRWVYPFFRLPPSVDLSDAKGLLVRARCKSNAQVRVFLWEGESGVGYINGSSLIPADDRWHAARVDFRALERSHANAIDPNGKLDLKDVRKISIGVNDQVDANELEIGDVFVVR
ncbi:glycosyl hydrolase [Paludisphaera rhizosphaerae]|uniref:glycosyl hydrolase n=1 Tax=Paludisphaera rhizosphaerae TaxID=2711216 RepID=UPI0013EC725F|nr:glycosyl hydrolase [Paludisphaera rhizosphaerae]